jgi:arginine decarboxylase
MRPMGLSDHRRIEATLSVADDDQTAARLISALRSLAEHAADLPRAKPVELPAADDLELEPVMLPCDAFFAAKETVPASEAVGRISAEQITPVPAGHPGDHPRRAHHHRTPGLPAHRPDRRDAAS